MRPAIQRLGNCSMFAFGGNNNSNPGATTPTTIGAGPLPPPAATGRVLPMIDRSPPNRCWKYSSLRITMLGSRGGAFAAGALPAGAAGAAGAFAAGRLPGDGDGCGLGAGAAGGGWWGGPSASRKARPAP